MTREDVFMNIKNNYGKYGVSDAEIEEQITSGEAQGFSYRTIYTGLRMAYGRSYNVEEYFTPDEMAEALGVTEEEVIEHIEQLRAEAEAMGEDADSIAYKTEPSEAVRFIIPANFLS